MSAKLVTKTAKLLLMKIARTWLMIAMDAAYYVMVLEMMLRKTLRMIDIRMRKGNHDISM